MKEKILIIDDDEEVVSSLQEILQVGGFSVLTANTAYAAQCLFSSADVAIIDLKLSDKHGLEVFKELKQVNPDSEAIIITGYADLKSAIEAINLEVFAYLEKPLNLDKLLFYVKRALERRSLLLEVKRREQEIKGLTGMTGEILNERILLMEKLVESRRQLEEKFQESERPLQVMLTLTRGGLDGLQSDQFLNLATEQTLEALNVDFSWIQIKDKSTGKLNIQTSQRSPISAIKEMLPLKSSQEVANEIFMSGRSVIINDITTVQYAMELPKGAFLNSFAAIPLKARQEIIGVLGVASLKKRNFKSHEIEILSDIGNDVIYSLEKRRLYDETKERMELLAYTLELAKVISSASDYNQICQILSDRLSKNMSIDCTLITHIDGKLGKLNIMGLFSTKGSNLKSGDSIALKGTITNYVADQKKTLVLQDLLQDKQFKARELPRNLGIRSIMCSPMLFKDETLGSFIVGSSLPNAYTDKDLKLAEGITSLLTIAVNSYLKSYKSAQLLPLFEDKTELLLKAEKTTGQIKENFNDLEERLHLLIKLKKTLRDLWLYSRETGDKYLKHTSSMLHDALKNLYAERLNEAQLETIESLIGLMKTQELTVNEAKQMHDALISVGLEYMPKVIE